MYDFYTLICRSHFSLPKRRALMTASLDYETWSWRVVAITESAIRAIAYNNFVKPSRKLSRDHTFPRAQTYDHKFFDEILSFDDWWNHVWIRDQTVLMTNEEHRDPSIRSVEYQIDPQQSYFTNSSVAGWHQTKAHEGELIKSLILKNNININIKGIE
jgi:hypothetical protein